MVAASESALQNKEGGRLNVSRGRPPRDWRLHEYLAVSTPTEWQKTLEKAARRSAGDHHVDTGCPSTVGTSEHAVCWDLTTCLCLEPVERKVDPFHVIDVEAKAQRSTAACSRPHSSMY